MPRLRLQGRVLVPRHALDERRLLENDHTPKTYNFNLELKNLGCIKLEKYGVFGFCTLNIWPRMRYCSQAFRSGGCSSNERLARYVASSKYCRTNKTLAKFKSTSALCGDTARARRKHSIDLCALPLMRQKFPIWLYS